MPQAPSYWNTSSPDVPFNYDSNLDLGAGRYSPNSSSVEKKGFGWSDLANLVGTTAGVAGDIIGGKDTFSRIAGSRLSDYFKTSNPEKTSNLFGLVTGGGTDPATREIIQAIASKYYR